MTGGLSTLPPLRGAHLDSGESSHCLDDLSCPTASYLQFVDSDHAASLCVRDLPSPPLRGVVPLRHNVALPVLGAGFPAFGLISSGL